MNFDSGGRTKGLHVGGHGSGERASEGKGDGRIKGHPGVRVTRHMGIGTVKQNGDGPRIVRVTAKHQR